MNYRSVAVLAVLATACEKDQSLGVLHSAAGRGGSGPSEEPVLVTELSDPEARDTDPSFTEDLRELYFMSERTGNKELWRSLRADPESAWGEPELVTELNTAGQEENPHISNDGRDIWFFTDRDRARGSLWHASRAARGDPWNPPEPVPELTTGEGSSDVSVAVDPTRTLFVLNSKLTGNQPYQLYEIARDGPDGAFAEPVLLREVVVTSVDEFDPDVRRGGRFLGFESRREGRSQIYVTARDDTDEPFQSAVPFDALRSEFDDGAPAFSEDLDYVMFSSNRLGSGDLYQAHVAPPF